MARAAKKKVAKKVAVKKVAAKVGSKEVAAATKVGGAAVVWTKRQRARLFGSVRPQAGDAGLGDWETAWATLRGLYGAPELYTLPEDADRKVERALEEVRAEFRTGQLPAKSTPERERLRLSLLMYEGESSREYYKNLKAVTGELVALWTGRWGLEFASRALWTPGVSCGSVTCGDARRTFAMKGQQAADPLGREELWWLHLRRGILAATPEEYEAVRGLWRELKVHEYVCAATFCRSPEAAHKLVARMVDRGTIPWSSIVMLAAITDAELALRFARAQPLNYACGADYYAFHVVDNLGAAAAPVLLALLERVSSGGDARRSLAAAAVLADPAACRAALPKLKGPAKTVLAAALK